MDAYIGYLDNNQRAVTFDGYFLLLSWLFHVSGFSVQFCVWPTYRIKL